MTDSARALSQASPTVPTDALTPAAASRSVNATGLPARVQGIHRAPAVANRRQRPVLMPFGAQNVGQQRRVAGIGLLARLTMAFSVPGDRTRVDRDHRQPRGLHRDHDQVLVGLDRDWHRHRIIAVLPEQRHELTEAGIPVSILWRPRRFPSPSITATS
jgi:hypothetical protein